MEKLITSEFLSNNLLLDYSNELGMFQVYDSVYFDVSDKTLYCHDAREDSNIVLTHEIKTEGQMIALVRLMKGEYSDRARVGI